MGALPAEPGTDRGAVRVRQRRISLRLGRGRPGSRGLPCNGDAPEQFPAIREPRQALRPISLMDRTGTADRWDPPNYNFEMRRLIASTLLVLSSAATLLAQERPNFVFILVDDMGWTDLGVYGSDLHETPRIDAFAAGSMRFTNAYAASPVCSPTRASILTGKHPARLHMTVWREAAKNPPLNRKLVPPVTADSLPHEEVTVAEVLREAGYVTAHVGKWHLGTAEFYPQTQGFDYNVGGTLWGAPQSFFYPYSGSRPFAGLRYVPHLGGGQPGEYLTDRLTTEALRILRRERGRPFFMHLAFHTVHTPIEGKPEFVEHYRGNLRPSARHRNPHLAAMVRSLDENVGRVLDVLDELGVAGDTVVVLTSDNGGYVNRYGGLQVTDNSPLRSGKGSLYEGGVRVPTIIRWPGVTPPGSVNHTPVSSVDYYRTILSVADLPGDRTHNRFVDGNRSRTVAARSCIRAGSRGALLPLSPLLCNHLARQCGPGRRLEADALLRGFTHGTVRSCERPRREPQPGS